MTIYKNRSSKRLTEWQRWVLFTADHREEYGIRKLKYLAEMYTDTQGYAL